MGIFIHYFDKLRIYSYPYQYCVWEPSILLLIKHRNIYKVNKINIFTP